ncbi:MAG: DUF2254 domain-containing protein [Acidobacteriota bacterium]
MTGLRHWWQETRSSFWFVPGLIVAAAAGLAAALIGIDVSIDPLDARRWPLLLGAGAAGARGLLTAVATSMVTVAGVVFSVTLVALSLASSQYTSRVLRNFMSDRVNQTVLGVFLGIFVYCLVVLRTLRGGDEGAFVPSLAVLGGLALAFVGIGFLIYFIHHISLSIQASNLIARVANETLETIDRQFPDELGPDDDEAGGSTDAAALPPEAWRSIPALASGYIESVDWHGLRDLVHDRHAIVRMERSVGDFVIEGAALVSVAGTSWSDSLTSRVNRIYAIGPQRTVQQDAGFGIRQLVDIAMRALSPGINDSTTAVMCVDYLSAILARMTSRRISPAAAPGQGAVSVVAVGPSFETFLDLAFDQIRQNAEGNPAILVRLLEALETISGRIGNDRRRPAMRRHADLITVVAARSIMPSERNAIEGILKRIESVLP